MTMSCSHVSCQWVVRSEQASELDDKAMAEQWVLCCLPGKHMDALRWNQAIGSVMLWAMFYWETSSPAIHVAVTLTCTIYLSVVADHVHPFIETVFPHCSGHSQLDNTLCHKAKKGQEWFEECNNNFKVLTCPPNSPDLSPVEHQCEVLESKSNKSMGALGEFVAYVLYTTVHHLRVQASMFWWRKGDTVSLNHMADESILVLAICIYGAYK